MYVQDDLGIYVMQIASIMTGMHPQTLRKYERAGLISPSRRNTIRLYSDEDIARLKMIKHLVEDKGLNLSGVHLFLQIREKLIKLKEIMPSYGMSKEIEERLTGTIDEILEMLGGA